MQLSDYKVQRTRRHRPLQRPSNRRNSTPAELFTPRPGKCTRSDQSRLTVLLLKFGRAAVGRGWLARGLPALLAKQMPRWDEAVAAASCPEAGRSQRVYTTAFIEHVCLRSVTPLIAGAGRSLLSRRLQSANRLRNDLRCGNFLSAQNTSRSIKSPRKVCELVAIARRKLLRLVQVVDLSDVYSAQSTYDWEWVNDCS